MHWEKLIPFNLQAVANEYHTAKRFCEGIKISKREAELRMF